MSEFHYKPLNRRKREIRLLHLIPGSASDDLKVQVLHVPFAKAKELAYEALSYTWGNEDDLQPIHLSNISAPSILVRLRRAHKESDASDEVDAGLLSITPNLALALRRLRRPDRVLRLWIDALCIDQKNNDEKAIEVARMGDIYRNAGSVLVWLGQGSEDSDLAMDTLKAMVDHVKNFEDGSTIQFIHTRRGSPYPWHGDSYEECHARRTAVSTLLQRPWFGRLWIWQELILATNAFMICGDVVLPYGKFRKAILMALGEVSHGEALHGCIDLKTRNIIMGLIKMPRQSPSLPVLFGHTKYAACKDPRDRIYALKSLLPQNIQLDIKPDYDKTASQVFKDATLSSIKLDNDLEMLTWCEMPFPTEWQSSWVPNLSSPRFTSSISYSHASGYSQPEVQYTGEHELLVNGIQATSVSEIVYVFSQDATYGDIIPVLQAMACDLFATVSTEEAKASAVHYLIQLITCHKLSIEHVDHCASETSEMYYESFMAIVNAEPGTLLEEPSEFATANRGLIDQAVQHFRGRAIYKTTEGFLGLGPAASQIGDHVCVLLGCNTPVILRPTPISGNLDQYRVVGATFIHNFMNTQAFLGPLQKSIMSWCSFHRGEYIFFYMYNGVVTEEDPRLGPLPHGWKVYEEHVYEGAVEADIAAGFESLPTLRRRLKRPRKGCFDPRLTSSSLRARGVRIMTFSLV